MACASASRPQLHSGLPHVRRSTGPRRPHLSPPPSPPIRPLPSPSPRRLGASPRRIASAHRLGASPRRIASAWRHPGPCGVLRSRVICGWVGHALPGTGAGWGPRASKSRSTQARTSPRPLSAPCPRAHARSASRPTQRLWCVSPSARSQGALSPSARSRGAEPDQPARRLGCHSPTPKGHLASNRVLKGCSKSFRPARFRHELGEHAAEKLSAAQDVVPSGRWGCLKTSVVHQTSCRPCVKWDGEYQYRPWWSSMSCKNLARRTRTATASTSNPRGAKGGVRNRSARRRQPTSGAGKDPRSERDAPRGGGGGRRRRL